MYWFRCNMYVVSLYVICWSHSLFSFCIFFFKQKTAYEMRISDWSSDVCSSDLRSASAIRNPGTLPWAGSEETMMEWMNWTGPTAAFFGVIALLLAGKIGRASCRERVCQYV